jgi:putative FmdB family regulatory protein
MIRSLELVGGSVPNHQGGSAMPVYEYRCDKCDREVTLTLSLREHEKGEVKCPGCGSESLRPLLSAFMSQTSKKS